LHHVGLLTACHPSLILGNGGSIEISQLAPHPLLLRLSFTAAIDLRQSSSTTPAIPPKALATDSAAPSRSVR
jgi:hypothetical protein